MHDSSSDSHDDNIRSLLNTLTSVENSKPVDSEPCFDIRFNVSPINKGFSTLVTTPRALVTETPILSMAQQNLFIVSPIKRPIYDGCGTSKDYFDSPFKVGSTILSPFKDSSLSPFKLLSQSPSQGSFDEWDKDFVASFEEKLFGITDVFETLDELMKSPQGKALLESKKASPNKAGSSVARQLKISPESRQKNVNKNFQALHDQSSDMFVLPLHIKTETVETCAVNSDKDNNLAYDHLYHEHNHYVNNILSAVDFDKMSATPIKPRLTNVDHAPVRRLAMKVMAGHNSVWLKHGATLRIDKNMSYNKALQQDQPMQNIVWPVKERLKYARLQFQEILNKAVEKEIEILKEEKQRKVNLKNTKHSKQKENVQRANSKFVPSKDSEVKFGTLYNTTISKNKVPKKRKKKGQYRQLDKVLSKPARNHDSSKRVQELVEGRKNSAGQQLHHSLYGSTGTSSNHSCCPSDDEDDYSDEDNVWTGSQPFHSQSSSGVYSEDNEEGVHIVKKKRKMLSDT